MLKATYFSWFCVLWVSFASGVVVVVVVTTIGGGVVVALDLLIIVSQCLKLPILNIFKEKTGQTFITQLPALAFL